MKISILLLPCVLIACAQQSPAPYSRDNNATSNKSYTGLQSTEQYAKDQAAMAQQEKMQQCLDAKSQLAKAQADNDDKSAQLMAAKVKSFCE